jgi:hypothetical protein
MTNTLAKLAAESVGVPKLFGPYEEEAIVSLALDYPEFFTGVGRFLTPSMFARIECQWVIAEILNTYEKFGVIPTRSMLSDRLIKSFTEDDPHEIVIKLINRLSEPREIPIIKDTLLRWAKDRAYGLLYSDEAQEAYTRGDYEQLEEIVKQANRIADVGKKGFWFFEHYEALFDPDVIEHRTTGFPRLDRMLNNGGPSPKEVLCWLAGTNLGKCSTLQSNIYEKENSRLYKLELEDGKLIELAGFREIQTTRGRIKVKDLTEGDSITEVPLGSDSWDLELPNV